MMKVLIGEVWGPGPTPESRTLFAVPGQEVDEVMLAAWAADDGVSGVDIDDPPEPEPEPEAEAELVEAEAPASKGKKS